MAGHVRTALLCLGLAATAASMVMLAPATLGTWRWSLGWALAFVALMIVQTGTACLAMWLRSKPATLAFASAELGALILWGAASLLRPEVWLPLDSAAGVTSQLYGMLTLFGLAGSLWSLRPTRSRAQSSWARRAIHRVVLLGAAATVCMLAVLGGVLAVDGAHFADFSPSSSVASVVRDGGLVTLPYCNRRGVPLVMDLYLPPATPGTRHPVVLYTHGGGFVLGSRTLTGVGGRLANHGGALVPELLPKLRARGIAVASVDYRLAPLFPWPAQLDDARCAVNFLRRHGAGLGIDSSRMALMGSSSGATLAMDVALGPPRRGALETSSAVSAVVDMFGASDLRLQGAGFMPRLTAALTFQGHRPAAASPLNLVHGGAPAFLVLHGLDDPEIPARQSADLVSALKASRNAVQYIPVSGTGHTLATAGEDPPRSRLAETIADFLAGKLS